MSYTKLANSILTSTVWMENDQTRIVWLTLLAMADQHGEVQASIPGLANVARVSIEDCESAIQTFTSPDRYSRTKSDEGRRLEEIDGGWFVINHEKYRDLSSDADRKKKAAMRQKRRRDRIKSGAKPEIVTLVTHVGVTGCDKSRQNTQAEAEAEAEKNTHPHSQRKNQKLEIPPELAGAFSRWAEWVFSTTGQAIPTIQAETLLMDLGRRGADKAARDIEFSILKGAKTILDSDNDFNKRFASERKGKPRVELQ